MKRVSFYLFLLCFTNTLFAQAFSTKTTGHVQQAAIKRFITGAGLNAKPPEVMVQTDEGWLDTNKILSQSLNYSKSHPVEKVYLHFDKPFYLAGENCWFKAYVVNASDFQRSVLSGILYVDWIDPAGEIIRHQKLKLYDGEANGDYSFTPGSPPGDYSVRAYTNLMKNDPDFFFTKSFTLFGNSSVGNSSTKKNIARSIDFQFFPEGGIAVNNIQTQIAFKAIDQDGKGIDVEGKIVDEKNEPVAVIKTIHKGMGLFPYIPSPNKSYRVLLSTGESFRLPPAAPAGVIMNVNNSHPGKIAVSIKASNEFLSAGFYLVGQSGGRICFGKTLKIEKNQTNIEISKSNLPAGVLQLTLFDTAEVPKSERMIFIDNYEKFQIAIESDQPEFKPRDSVSLKLKATYPDGNPVETSLSVSVTDAGITTEDFRSDNIVSQLLLQSDIKGYIDDAGWYFETKNKWALDLVMLTNGWRKFDWGIVLDNQTPPVKYKAEQALALEGSVRGKSNNKPIANALLTLLVSSLDYNGFYTAESDHAGRFRLENVDFSDSTVLIWQVHDTKGKPLDADIIIISNNDTPAISKYRIPANKTDEILQNRIAALAGASDTTSKYQLLTEVRVADRRKLSVGIGKDTRLIRPGKDDLKLYASVFIASYAPALPFLQEIISPDGTSHWVMRNGAAVNLFIDGQLIDSSANPYLAMSSYRADQIEYVVVSGDYHLGYLIAMKTKKDITSGMNKGIIKQLAPGYQWTRTFYHPKYGPNDIASSFPDKRITLYWNPYLITDADGKAVINFYNSDTAKHFNVVAEGLADGRMGCQVSKF